jgi:hypothetical protein
MKLSIDALDDDIKRIEERIARERAVLNEAVTGCTNSVRELVTSPKTLLALAGLGFGIGRVMFTGKSAPTAASSVAKPGVVGLLTGVAGTALSLAGGSKFGVGGIARWAMSKALAKRKQSRGAGHVNAAPRTPSTVR